MLIFCIVSLEPERYSFYSKSTVRWATSQAMSTPLTPRSVDFRVLQPGSFRAWMLAFRPATLGLSFMPVLVGSAIAFAQHSLPVGPALAALASALLIQIGTNLANDVFDHKKGADTQERLGPLRVTQAGLLTERQVLTGMVIAFAFAIVSGIYLTAVSGYPVVVLGVLSIAAGIAYTAGPWPLGYNGLGDVCVLLFFGGVAVCGTVWVETGSVPFLAYAASLPVGALATAVLVVNNVRDCETDTRAGKRTLVVRFGRQFGIAEYRVLLAVAYLIPLALLVVHQASMWILLPYLTAPKAWKLAQALANEKGAALNQVLVRTAQLCLQFGVLFAIGLGQSKSCAL